MAVVVTNLLRKYWLALAICIFAALGPAKFVIATVLPDERADALYHSYDGGGVEVTGPSILVRKNTSTNTSVFYNYYVDHISSASLDVLIGGSPYTEKRTEQSLGIDYVHGKTLMSLSYTNSQENDYLSNTMNFNMSQDFFGDLTTLTMGYTLGNDKVSKRGLSYDLSSIDRQNFRIGISQVITRKLEVAVNWETITDDATELNNSGVTLNNPYRSYSYCSTTACDARSYAPEIYPNTHTSNALAFSGNFYLDYRAAVHALIRFYQDDWGIHATTYQIGYTQPYGRWLFDVRARWYSQNNAYFYSDLFAYQDEYTFMGRDKELADFRDTSIGVSASYEFLTGGWHWVDKGTMNFAWDHVEYNYNDYRNALVNAPPADQPLYSFGANIYQIFVSFWY